MIRYCRASEVRFIIDSTSEGSGARVLRETRY